MGVLGGLGDAAKSATDEATDNAAGDLVDAVAGGLAGKSGSAASGTVAWIEGDTLATETAATTKSAQSESVGSQAGGVLHNALKLDRKLQFLHFGYAHDDGVDAFPGKPGGSHGIAFRAALIREAVLVHSFARAAQTVLAEAQKSKGAAGAMLAMAGSLLGGSKQAAAGPEAIDPILAAIQTTTKAVNLAQVKYPDTHKAGKDLAKAWADLDATCKSALDPSKGGGGGLPSLPLGKLIPSGVPKVIAEIPAWLFKVQDCYMAMFREARAAYEWPIMKICHGYSIAAIRDRRQPDYDIWFLPKPGAAKAFAGSQTGAEETLESAQKNLQSLPPFPGSGAAGDAAGGLGDVQEAIAQARTGARDSAGDIAGWLATAASAQAEMPPGSAAALEQAIGVLKGIPQPPPGLPKVDPLAEVIGRGLAQGLGLKGALPGFLQTFVGITSEITLTLLPKVLAQVHGRYGKPEPALIMAGVHEAIASRIVDLVWALIFGKGSAPKANDAHAMKDSGSKFGEGLAHGQLATGGLPGAAEAENKAADLVRGFIASQAHYLDAIVLFVAEDLVTAVMAPYGENSANDTLSMESYLGRLPLYAALLSRNLVFPVFNLLMQVFGIGDKLAGLVWNPVDEKVKQVTQLAQDVKDTKEQVRRGGQNVQQASHDKDKALDQELGDLTKIDAGKQDTWDKAGQAEKLSDEVQKTPDDMAKAATKGDTKAPVAGPAAPSGNGPLTSKRIADGEAVKVTLADILKAGRVDATPEKTALAARAKAPPAAAPAPTASPVPAGLPGL